MHEKWTQHSHCESCFGRSDPYCDRHSNQRIQGELFISRSAITLKNSLAPSPIYFTTSIWAWIDYRYVPAGTVLCVYCSSWQKIGHLVWYCANLSPSYRKHLLELQCWAYALWALTGKEISSVGLCPTRKLCLPATYLRFIKQTELFSISPWNVL